MHRDQIRRWIKQAEELEVSRTGSRHVYRGRSRLLANGNASAAGGVAVADGVGLGGVEEEDEDGSGDAPGDIMEEGGMGE